MTTENLDNENLNIEVKVHKKRGRKPKNKDLIQEIKQPKKRGRKPKIKTEEQPKVLKKRGRKPNSLINTDNKIIHENKSLKDNVLHLKINSDELNSNGITDIYNYNPEINNPKPYEPDNQIFKSLSLNLNPIEYEKPHEVIYDNKSLIDNKKIVDTNNNIDKELNNKYKKVNLKKNKIKSLMVYYNEYNKRREWPKTSDLKCFWCCHNFDKIPCAIPVKYNNNNFYVFGNFCSKECAAAYNFEMNDNNIWERYSLLNYLYSILTENNDLKIKLAPSRLCLSIFGGNLSIEEFRNCNEDYSLNYKVIFPPMVSVIPSMEEIKKDVLKNNKSTYIPIDKERILRVNNDLRLKRKNPITNRNTLENCMKLTYN
jgi:hypothetical protein